VAGIIDEIQVYCPYKKNGCLENTDLGEMQIHEQTCRYKKIPKFLQNHRDEDYDKDLRDHIYGGRQDNYAERLETDVTNVDLITRLYNKNKTVVTNALGKNKCKDKKNQPTANNESPETKIGGNGMGGLFDDWEAMGLQDSGDDGSASSSSNESDMGYLGARDFSKFDRASDSDEEAVRDSGNLLAEEENFGSLPKEAEGSGKSSVFRKGPRKRIKPNPGNTKDFGDDWSKMF